jgi:hypothetical protein
MSLLIVPRVIRMNDSDGVDVPLDTATVAAQTARIGRR